MKSYITTLACLLSLSWPVFAEYNAELQARNVTICLEEMENYERESGDAVLKLLSIMSQSNGILSCHILVEVDEGWRRLKKNVIIDYDKKIKS